MAKSPLRRGDSISCESKHGKMKGFIREKTVRGHHGIGSTQKMDQIEIKFNNGNVDIFERFQNSFKPHQWFSINDENTALTIKKSCT